MGNKLTLDHVKQIAKQKGGQFLSDTYEANSIKYKWKCSKGHVWEATVGNIKNGRWCPKCAIIKRSSSRKLKMSEIRNIAKDRNFILHSTTYVNNSSLLEWECENGHRWKASIANIKRGRNCPICSKKTRADSQRDTIENMKKLAKSRGGKCLSKVYLTARKKLLWECKYGHKWENTPTNIKKGSWCPECSTGLGERICRVYFETMFNKKFPKVRFSWLKNSNGNVMELDGYCAELKIAFEHQGIQHYRKSFYSQNDKLLKFRKADDKIKSDLCKQHGITLISIPSIITIISINELKQWLIDAFRKIEIPANLYNIHAEINLKKAYTSIRSHNFLKQAKAIAESKNGELLSNEYISAHKKLKFKCQKGHVWLVSLANIKSGKWCPICGRTITENSRRTSIEVVKDAAKKFNGKLISKSYKNQTQKLEWQCENGHRFFKSYTKVKDRGQWCPQCHKEKIMKK